MRPNPLSDLEELLDRMSRQVEEGVTGLDRSVPADLVETDEEFVATLDLPGYDAADVDLTVTDRQLRVEAERSTDATTAEDADGDTRVVRRERTRSSVSRSVRLPGHVDEEGVTATLDDGVLTVTLPKTHPDEGRTIEID